jgi:hypothetical protein
MRQRRTSMTSAGSVRLTGCKRHLG